MHATATSPRGSLQRSPWCPFGHFGHCNLVVADFSDDCVHVLRYSDGTRVRTIDTSGAFAGHIIHPSSVAFDAAGHIVIAEHMGRCVHVLSYCNGSHVRTISIDDVNGQSAIPRGGIVIDRDGRIVVAGNRRQSVHDLE